MLKSNAAAIVGAGVLSVLIFPAIAAALHRKGKNKTGPPTGEPVPVDGSTAPASEAAMPRRRKAVSGKTSAGAARDSIKPAAAPPRTARR